MEESVLNEDSVLSILRLGDPSLVAVCLFLCRMILKRILSDPILILQLNQVTMPWDLFLSKFCSWIGLNEELNRNEWVGLGLKVLCFVLTEEEGTVRRMRFRFLQNWFGPVKRGGKILQIMAKAPTFRWFHGRMNAEQAVHLLSGRPAGTFLVRFAPEIDISRAYVISRVKNDQRTISHQRINYNPEKCVYYLPGSPHSSVEAATIFEFVSLIAPLLGLTNPLPGSYFRGFS